MLAEVIAREVPKRRERSLIRVLRPVGGEHAGVRASDWSQKETHNHIHQCHVTRKTACVTDKSLTACRRILRCEAKTRSTATEAVCEIRPCYDEANNDLV